jgi:hypothetical protein
VASEEELRRAVADAVPAIVLTGALVAFSFVALLLLVRSFSRLDRAAPRRQNTTAFLLAIPMIGAFILPFYATAQVHKIAADRQRYGLPPKDVRSASTIACVLGITFGFLAGIGLTMLFFGAFGGDSAAYGMLAVSPIAILAWSPVAASNLAELRAAAALQSR